MLLQIPTQISEGFTSLFFFDTARPLDPAKPEFKRYGTVLSFELSSDRRQTFIHKPRINNIIIISFFQIQGRKKSVLIRALRSALGRAERQN